MTLNSYAYTFTFFAVVVFSGCGIAEPYPPPRTQADVSDCVLGKRNTAISGALTRAGESPWQRLKSTFIEHKQDVDPVEDGCIGRVKLTLVSEDGECPLKLDFHAREGDRRLALLSASLDADSQCKGFLDEVEGRYEYERDASEAPSVSLLAPAAIAEPNADEVCEDMVLEIDGQLILELDGKEPVELNFDKYTLRGALYSYAADELACPAP